MSQSSTAVVVRTGVKAGGRDLNHNQAVIVKTGVKAGGVSLNHNESQGGLKVKTGVKARGARWG